MRRAARGEVSTPALLWHVAEGQAGWIEDVRNELAGQRTPQEES